MALKGPRPARTAGQAAVPEAFVLPIFQLRGERSRMVATGRRTDDGDRCELVVIADTGGSVALYPHGAAKFGVRLDEATAVTVAQAILAVACGEPPVTELREALDDRRQF